jgi:MSHA biogenesis protein MshI
MQLRKINKRDIQVGVQLCADGIALASASSPGTGEPRISACGFWPCASEERAACLARAVDQLGLRGARAVAVLSPGEYVLRAVEAPAVPDAELRKALRWSLGEVVDLDLEHAIVDAIPVPVRERRGRGRIVYALAAEKSRLGELARQIEASGLRLAAIDVSELALRNLVARAPSDANGVLTLAVHERIAALSVTRDAALYVTRWADCDLEALGDELGKGSPGAEFSGPELDALVLEIQRSLDYYHHELGQRPAAGVLIAPLPLELPELPRRLANALGLEVGWLAPEALVESSGPIDPGAWARSAAAIGAALRAPDDAVGGLQQVDLYRDDVVLRAPKLDARALLHALGTLAGFLLLVSGCLLTWGGVQLRRTDVLRERTALAEGSLAELEARYKAHADPAALDAQIAKLEAELKLREQLIALIGASSSNRSGFSPQLESLAHGRIDGLWLESFHFREGGRAVDLSGRTLQPELVPGFVLELGKQAPFENAEFESLLLERPQEGDPLRFEIRTAAPDAAAGGEVR